MSNQELTKEKITIAQWLLNPDQPQREITNWLELERQLEANGLEKVFYEIELPLVPILRRMESLGIGLDRQALADYGKKVDKQSAELEAEIYKLAGRQFNINSSQQLAEIIFGRRQSTSARKLESLRDKQPLVAPILRFRELAKLKSTYIEPFLALSAADGRLHTQFIQTGTATGRLSSREPNLQNLPPEIKKFFIPSLGYELAAFDYSQIELRILATVAEDEKMLEAFESGVDIHKLTASQIFDVPLGEVTAEMRRLGKTLNFGVVYGMGSRAFAQAAKIPLEQAQNFIDEFFNDFPQIRLWQRRVVAETRKGGYVENLDGRKRWLGLNVYAGVIVNMPIQSLAADIIKLAMIKIDQKLSPRLLLSVHDELLFEIENDKLEEKSAAIKVIMESVYPLAVPLAVNVKLREAF